MKKWKWLLIKKRFFFFAGFDHSTSFLTIIIKILQSIKNKNKSSKHCNSFIPFRHKGCQSINNSRTITFFMSGYSTILIANLLLIKAIQLQNSFAFIQFWFIVFLLSTPWIQLILMRPWVLFNGDQRIHDDIKYHFTASRYRVGHCFHPCAVWMHFPRCYCAREINEDNV